MPNSSPVAPKSALRHRPLGSHGATQEPPRVPRASRAQPQPATRTTAPGEIPAWKQVSMPRAQRQHQRMLFLGLGMVLAVLIVCVGQLFVGWVSTISDDLRYGRPRTFQTDAVVGHSDSQAHPSHFIALNLQGRVEIIELPGGDAARARIFVGPRLYGSNADLVPITLQFVDTRHDRHPDMLVLFQGTHLTYRNAQGTFQLE